MSRFRVYLKSGEILVAEGKDPNEVRKKYGGDAAIAKVKLLSNSSNLVAIADAAAAAIEKNQPPFRSS
jgi:hypothetical protein